MPYADRERTLQYLRDYRREQMLIPGNRAIERKRQRDRYRSDYDRRTHQYTMTVRLNGKRIPYGESKRQFLGFCELCHEDIAVKSVRGKDYHHWDGVADLGMWLCHHCHMVAEAIDNRGDFIDRYKELKAEIVEEYKIVKMMKEEGLWSDPWIYEENDGTIK